MSTSTASPADGPLILRARMRADLVITPRPTRHGRWWTVKDPLSLSYFQLRDEEVFVLRHLDGRTPVADILHAFWRRHAPVQLTLDELLSFVHRLAALGLITSDVAPPAMDLVARRDRRSARTWRARLLNPLAIRWRGIDPQPWLDRVYPLCRWMFSPPVLAAGAAVVAAALLLIVSEWARFQVRLPAASAILAPGNLIWIAVAIAFVKVLHELGHALTCRHLGGECHELGVMLLAFIPCLYCNVSDAWLFSSRWRRIAVSAAGIGVELFLAAVCTFLWWYSDPSPFNSICLSVMIVTSAGTLLLNGNPLLRYDGYYVLADLLDVPNLRGRAGAALRRYFARWVFGVVEPNDDSYPARWRAPLALYGAASALYVWLVLWVLLRFFDQALEPHGLRPAVVVLATVAVGTRLASVASGAWRRVAIWRSEGIMRPIRFSLGCLMVGGAAVLVLAVPFPHRVAAPLTIVPRDARPIHVTAPGAFAAVENARRARYGERVSAGDVIAVLENQEIGRDLVRLEAECQRQRIVVESLRRQQLAAPESAARLSSARAVLEDLQQQLEQRQRDHDQLVITAPATGVLYPPPRETMSEHHALHRERGPLEDRNANAFLTSGTVVGVVGAPAQFDALLVVDQVDVPYVRVGQMVRLGLAQGGPDVCAGRVVEVATRTLETLPEPLVRDGRLPSRVGPGGLVVPVRPVYEVRVEIDDPAFLPVVGGTGEGRIEVGRMTAARRLLRWFEATFARDR